MTHRNRLFTELKNGWSFHGELLNNQMVLGLHIDSPNTHHFRLENKNKHIEIITVGKTPSFYGYLESLGNIGLKKMASNSFMYVPICSTCVLIPHLPGEGC